MDLLSILNNDRIRFAGIATGIDTDAIINGITRIQQNRINLLKQRQDNIIAKKNAIANLKTYLQDLQNKANELARPLASAFDSKTAVSSDPDIVTVNVRQSAQPGQFKITAIQTAQNHIIASNALSDPNTIIKQGSLTIRVGEQEKTIIIDNSNNTLQNIVHTINNVFNNLQATIFYDPQSQGYRIMLSANETGTRNSISITNNLNSGDGSSINFVERILQESRDAIIKLGTGPDAINVISETNIIDNIIPGLSLTITKSDPDKQVDINVNYDIQVLIDKLNDFFASYNQIITYIRQNIGYDHENKKSGTLSSVPEVYQIVDNIRDVFIKQINGIDQAINNLSQYGITYTNDGQILLNESDLKSWLSKNGEDAIKKMQQLFGITGSSDSNNIVFRFASYYTKPGTYTAEIIAPAQRAVLTAQSSISDINTIDNDNNQLSLRIDNITFDITIPSGSYTKEEIVNTISQTINNKLVNSNSRATINLTSDDKIQIISNRYGMTSRVSILGGTALNTLGFTGNESATGTDTIGRFIIDNATIESAYGNGQVLIGAEGNQHTDGLQIVSYATAPSEAHITVQHGLAAKLFLTIDKFVNISNGRLNKIIDELNNQINTIDKDIVRQNEILLLRRDNLLKRFIAMENQVNNLKALQSQIASIMFNSVINYK